MTNLEEQHYWKLGLLEICQRIHMNRTGSASYPGEVIEGYNKYLLMRLDRWKESYSSLTKDYDLAVFHLCNVVLGP